MQYHTSLVFFPLEAVLTRIAVAARPDGQIGHPVALTFEFKLSADDRTLLLNDEPILPRAHPHIPAPLHAYATTGTVANLARPVNTYFSIGPRLDLDYYINTPDVTSETSIYNTKYNPRLRFDVLHANTTTAKYNGTIDLSSNLQNQIWVFLEDLSDHPPNTPYSSIPLRIKDVQVNRRWRDHNSNGTTTYKSVKDLKTCHIWSWLCADIDGYPYYEWIYRENFDEHGKKGSMRHLVTKNWDSIVALVGATQAALWLAVCIAPVLLLGIYAVFRGLKWVVDVHRNRVQEVDDWLADEEVEGLLRSDRYLEGLWESEKKLAERKASEKTNVKEAFPLPPPYLPPPHYTPMAEKSSTS